MARKKNNRKMEKPPLMRGYRPFGTSFCPKESVELLFEEFEALRLADYESDPHHIAAAKMGVSRPTFTRILDRAHYKLSRALVESRYITIEKGNVVFEKIWYKCEKCSTVFSREGYRNLDCPFCHSEETYNLNTTVQSEEDTAKNRATLEEPGSYCICISCGKRRQFQKGIPCRQKKCEDCGREMTRETGSSMRV